MGLIARTSPACTITGGEKTAATLNARLIGVEVVDAAGLESDSVRIDIDASGLDTWPETGQKIGVSLGYLDTGLQPMGEFRLSRIAESLLPNTLTLTGTAAPFEAADPTEFKKRRSATYADTTVLAVVQAIAARHGFTPRIHADLAGQALEHCNQDNETDIRFLSRLAKAFDAVCKPVDKFLVFSRRGQLKSLSGRALVPVLVSFPGAKAVDDLGFTNASIVSGDRNKASGVSVFWYDDATGQDIEVELGSAPRKRLRTTFNSAGEATRQGEAELRRLAREGDKLSLDCPGDPQLAAEGLLQLQGFPSARMNGDWSVDRVTHSYKRNQGYRCRVEATVPDQ